MDPHYTNVAFLLPNVPNLLIAQYILNCVPGAVLRLKTPLSSHLNPLLIHFTLVSGEAGWIIQM